MKLGYYPRDDTYMIHTDCSVAPHWYTHSPQKTYVLTNVWIISADTQCSINKIEGASTVCVHLGLYVGLDAELSFARLTGKSHRLTGLPGKLPLLQMASPPLFSTKWNRNFETYGSSVVNALSKDWSWICLIVPWASALVWFSSCHQTHPDSGRLSEVKLFKTDGWNLLNSRGLNTLFISSGTLSGIVFYRKLVTYGSNCRWVGCL